MKKYPHQPLAVISYDPIWPELYQEERNRIQEKLRSYLIRIEHIGSTAIPGLSAKPIIDILIVVSSEATAEKCLPLLMDLDYEFVDKPDQYYLRKSTGETTGFHVHMTTEDSKFWLERLAFKSYLLEHPEAREEYARLKQELVQQSGDDRRIYREGKADFMATITEKALREFGEA